MKAKFFSSLPSETQEIVYSYLPLKDIDERIRSNVIKRELKKAAINALFSRQDELAIHYQSQLLGEWCHVSITSFQDIISNNWCSILRTSLDKPSSNMAHRTLGLAFLSALKGNSALITPKIFEEFVLKLKDKNREVRIAAMNVIYSFAGLLNEIQYEVLIKILISLHKRYNYDENIAVQNALVTLAQNANETQRDKLVNHFTPMLDGGDDDLRRYGVKEVFVALAVNANEAQREVLINLFTSRLYSKARVETRSCTETEVLAALAQNAKGAQCEMLIKVFKLRLHLSDVNAQREVVKALVALASNAQFPQFKELIEVLIPQFNNGNYTGDGASKKSLSQ